MHINLHQGIKEIFINCVLCKYFPWINKLPQFSSQLLRKQKTICNRLSANFALFEKPKSFSIKVCCIITSQFYSSTLSLETFGSPLLSI